ncbi:MAG: 5-(carboxyamino)imidazole ribonucleotide synthase [Novosphingobium sp.]|nr:5-(carboxyamino)imidazole ribonucleotide synthase [Novosphingobium sp.]
MIPPGETIGILGGGQLGRMLAVAAARLGYRCHVFAPEADSIAAEVCAAHTRAPWTDTQALAAFAADCAVVTYEWENVPVGSLKALGGVPLYPGAHALEVAQDRLSEKQFVTQLGGRTAPFMAVDTPEDLDEALTVIGSPGILKTRREGYDGKGQYRIMYDHEAEGIALTGQAMIFEGFVHFSAEFSVILARAQDGTCVFWDSAENVHEHGILTRSTVPASAAVQAQVAEARALAKQVADALGYVGVAAFEFFATEDGPVFNEMAPRVHNSGHWTIEGALTSQFENHIRAICGLPLGDTRLAATAVEMRNIVGEAAEDWSGILSDPANHLHLYGKAAARPGRKMGHVTRLVL